MDGGVKVRSGAGGEGGSRGEGVGSCKVGGRG